MPPNIPARQDQKLLYQMKGRLYQSVCPKNFGIFRNPGERAAPSPPVFHRRTTFFPLRPDGDDIVPVHPCRSARSKRSRTESGCAASVKSESSTTMAWDIVAGDKSAVPAEIPCPRWSEVVALLNGQNSSRPSVCMWRNFEARIDMVMTLFIASSAPPAMSGAEG